MFVDLLEDYLRAAFQLPVYKFSNDPSEYKNSNCIYYELDQTSIQVKLNQSGYSFDFPLTVAIRDTDDSPKIGWITSRLHDMDSRIDNGSIQDFDGTEYIEKNNISETIISKQLSISIHVPIDAVREKLKYLTLETDYSESQTKE